MFLFGEQDVEDPNPLIRALAIRTMGYIQVEKIIDCLVDPLSHCLRDQDPYVRKTAAICVAKLYMYDRALVESERFIEKLRDLLNDPNPTVRAAARLVRIAMFGMLLICSFRLLRTLLLHLRKYLSVRKISN
jgi:vesicle coat complex subunit